MARAYNDAESRTDRAAANASLSLQPIGRPLSLRSHPKQCQCPKSPARAPRSRNRPTGSKQGGPGRFPMARTTATREHGFVPARHLSTSPPPPPAHNYSKGMDTQQQPATAGKARAAKAPGGGPQRANLYAEKTRRAPPSPSLQPERNRRHPPAGACGLGGRRAAARARPRGAAAGHQCFVFHRCFG